MNRLQTPSNVSHQTAVEDVVTAWQRRLARPGLFPVIKLLGMSTGYPSSSVLSTLILLTHAFPAETSSFLRRRGEETWLALRLRGGGWVRCVRRHLPHLSDVGPLVLPCPSLSNPSADASNFTPERLPSWGDGPFLRVSGNSSFSRGHGRWRRCSSASQFLQLLLPFCPPPPFLKIIKAPTAVVNLHGKNSIHPNKE